MNMLTSKIADLLDDKDIAVLEKVTTRMKEKNQLFKGNTVGEGTNTVGTEILELLLAISRGINHCYPAYENRFVSKETSDVMAGIAMLASGEMHANIIKLVMKAKGLGIEDILPDSDGNDLGDEMDRVEKVIGKDIMLEAFALSGLIALDLIVYLITAYYTGVSDSVRFQEARLMGEDNNNG